MLKIKNVAGLAASTAMVATAIAPMAAFAVDDAGGMISGDTATLTVGKTFQPNTPTPAAFEFTLEAVGGQDDMGTAIQAANVPMPATTVSSGADQGKAVVTLDNNGNDWTSSTALQSGGFDSIQYTAPGAYVYKVVEKDPGITGMDNDTNYYYVVVYVVSDTDNDGSTLNTVHVENIKSWHQKSGGTETLPLASVVDLMDAAENSTKTSTDGAEFGKVASTQFVNELPSSDLIITKNVTGNLGHKSEVFPVQVAFTDLAPGATYTVTTTNGPAAASLPSGESQPTSVVANNSGAATATFYVTDETSITIANLNVGAHYTVTEQDPKDHVPSYEITAEGGNDATIANASADGTKDTALATSNECVDAADGDVTVAFENERTFKNVTGVPFIAIPFGIAALAGGAGALVARKRKSNINL